MATGDELRQLPNSQFYVEGPTVAVGSLLEDTRIVQVYAGGVRILNAGKFISTLHANYKKKRIQKAARHVLTTPFLFVTMPFLFVDCRITKIVPIGEHLSIVAASIVDPYVLLQLHDGSAMILKGDMANKDVQILSQPSILNVGEWDKLRYSFDPVTLLKRHISGLLGCTNQQLLHLRRYTELDADR